MNARSIFLAVLLACAPAAARAQAAEHGTFVMTRGADTAMVERFSRAPDGVQGDLTLTSAAHIVFSAPTAADASVTGLELRAWRLGVPDSTPPLQHGTVTFAGDSAHVVIDAGGQHLDQTVHGARGSVPLFNPSAILIEQVLMRARALGGDSVAVPIFAMGASTRTSPAVVRWHGDSAVATIGAVEVRARVDALGRLLGASIPSQNVRIERTTRAVAAVQPDYSPPAGAPYAAEEVRVPTGGGFALAGTLTLPFARTGRVPAVVTITGSGLEDRDEAIPIVPGYRIFRQVADTLGRRGIAVLRMDDRGFGASGGDPTAATSRDFADDIRAAVAYLRTRPEIDPDRIALVGHSEGGLIGPMVAASDPRIRALVAIAGPAWTGQKVIDYQVRYAVEQDASIPAARRDSALRVVRARADSMLGRVPWFRWFVAYDPLPTARRVHQPVLLLQGANDRQVTAEQAQELAAAIRAGGNRDVTVRVFPGLDHLMVPDPTGNPATYPRLPSGRVSPAVLGALADWLAAKLK